MTLKILKLTEYFGGSTREEHLVSEQQLAAGVDIASFIYKPYRSAFEPFTAKLVAGGKKVEINGPAGTRFYPVDRPGEYRTDYITVDSYGATIEGSYYEKETDVKIVVFLEP